MSGDATRGIPGPESRTGLVRPGDDGSRVQRRQAASAAAAA